MKKQLLSAVLAAAVQTLALQTNAQSTTDAPYLTGTWATAAEYTGQGDMPQNTLAGKTLRQTIKVSIGGEEMQQVLSNEHSDEPVEISQVYVADALEGAGINAKTARTLTFGGRKSITIEPRKTATSDPFRYGLKAGQLLSISICYGQQVPEHATSHRGSRTTSYIAEGMVGPKKTFVPVEQVDHWYNICQLNILTRTGQPPKAVAVLGNSITDGRGSTTNMQNRWPDQMAKRLTGTGVLNLGIGGNCVVSGGLSEPALVRFDRDILRQKGVETLVIFQGTNDIGTSPHAERTATQLTEAYKTLAAKAREAGIKHVVGATITPFKGNGWYSPYHEAARQVVNEWIRTTDVYDAVIDFDLMARDPQDPERLRADISDDGLHLNAKGYDEMGAFAARVLQKLQ